MHIDLTPSDIDRTHRIGQRKASSKKSRAVIIKFVSYNTRKIKKKNFFFLIKNFLKEHKLALQKV